MRNVNSEQLEISINNYYSLQIRHRAFRPLGMLVSFASDYSFTILMFPVKVLLFALNYLLILSWSALF